MATPSAGPTGMMTCLPCSLLLPWPHPHLLSLLPLHSCPASGLHPLPQHLPALGLPLLDTLPWLPTTCRRKPTSLNSALRGLSQWPCSLLHFLSQSLFMLPQPSPSDSLGVPSLPQDLRSHSAFQQKCLERGGYPTRLHQSGHSLSLATTTGSGLGT